MFAFPICRSNLKTKQTQKTKQKTRKTYLVNAVESKQPTTKERMEEFVQPILQSAENQISAEWRSYPYHHHHHHHRQHWPKTRVELSPQRWHGEPPPTTTYHDHRRSRHYSSIPQPDSGEMNCSRAPRRCVAKLPQNQNRKKLETEGAY